MTKTAHSISIAGGGELNGVHFNAEGQGRGDPDKGHITFEVEFSPTPPRANPFGSLLSTLIIPTVAFGLEKDSANNMLTLAPDGFSFVQAVMGDDVVAESTGTFYRRSAQEFSWHAHTLGTVTLPAVIEVDPFTAIMIPQGRGKVMETISMNLRTADGDRSISFLRTFTFPPHRDLPQPQLRHMTLKPAIRLDSIAVELTAAIVPFRTGGETARPQ